MRLIEILCNLTEIFVQFDTTLVKFYSNFKICQIGYNCSQNFIEILIFFKLDTILVEILCNVNEIFV